MISTIMIRSALIAPMVGLGLTFAALQAYAQPISPVPTESETTEFYEATEPAAVRKRLEEWIENVAPDQLTAWQERLTVQEESNDDSLTPIVTAARLTQPLAGKFITQIEMASRFELLGLIENGMPQVDEAWVQANLQLWLALELSQRQLYEEALNQFEQTDIAAVVEPASFLFHRAVCEHHLLKRTEAIASLETLLNKTRPLPTRYRMVGELMQQDLASLEEESLNEVARKMRDVERRLDIGRSGQKVQKLEKEIIESLDDLIAKLEQQAGGGGGGGGGGQGNESSSPLDESRVKGSTAPGEVDDKNLGRKDGWGDLPPKQQAQAKQILGTLFPPHYQRAIEAYNKKNAQREQRQP